VGASVDGSKSSMILFWEGRLWPRILSLILPFRRAICCVSGSILDLDIFLSSREDVPHLGDFTLQFFVEEWMNCSPLTNTMTTMSSLQL